MKWRGSVLHRETSITARLSPEDFTYSLIITTDVSWCQCKYLFLIYQPILHIACVSFMVLQSELYGLRQIKAIKLLNADVKLKGFF